jgi:signal peptidase II
MRLLFWTGFWVFLLDQASKYYVLHILKLDLVKRIEIWDPFLVFQMAWNRGVNFGLFADYDMRWALIVVALVISGGVLWWLSRAGATRLGFIAGGLLVGGALGNVIDRLLYGAVADFLNMSCCGISNPFAFNVADIAIFLGAVALALLPEPGKAKPVGKNRS